MNTTVKLNETEIGQVYKKVMEIIRRITDGTISLAWVLQKLQHIIEGVGVMLLIIDRPTSFDPAKFIGAGWSIWKGPADGDGLSGEEDQDGRALAITTLDLAQVQFVDMLKSGETVMNGEEKQKCLKEAGHIRLDAGIFWRLWKNPHLIPESWKEKINGNVRYIHFDGTILRSKTGHRYVPYFYWYERRWYESQRLLNESVGVYSLSAVLTSPQS